MKRILLTIEYEGTGYNGWQRQIAGLGIQQVIEDAIATAQGETVLFGSGRTDAGVHAYGQKAHFDCTCSIPESKWKFYLNNILPDDIRIVESQQVEDNFHARYWAKEKTYEYHIYNNNVSSAIRRNQSFFVPSKLDFEKMKQASRLFLGEHDFLAFMSTRADERENTFRKISDVELIKEGKDIIFSVTGNGFLHNMVRIMAGTLIYIGCGKREIGDIEKAYQTLQRECLGCTAAASGLFLKDVRFYDSFEQKMELWWVDPKLKEE